MPSENSAQSVAETTDKATGGVDRPDWLPDEYEPDDSLYDRLPIMADLEGGVELHVETERTTEVVGRPKGLTENHAGTYILKAGFGSGVEWEWEIVVPEEADARLKNVDPMQDVEAYEATKKTWLRDVDVRIWGVDAEAWLGRDSE